MYGTPQQMKDCKGCTCLTAELRIVLQSPDLAKVKEELSRLQKRLKSGTKLVEEKQKVQKEQSQLTAKLRADLENVTDGKQYFDRI